MYQKLKKRRLVGLIFLFTTQYFIIYNNSYDNNISSLALVNDMNELTRNQKFSSKKQYFHSKKITIGSSIFNKIKNNMFLRFFVSYKKTFIVLFVVLGTGGFVVWRYKKNEKKKQDEKDNLPSAISDIMLNPNDINDENKILEFYSSYDKIFEDFDENLKNIYESIENIKNNGLQWNNNDILDEEQKNLIADFGNKFVDLNRGYEDERRENNRKYDTIRPSMLDICLYANMKFCKTSKKLKAFRTNDKKSDYIPKCFYRALKNFIGRAMYNLFSYENWGANFPLISLPDKEKLENDNKTIKEYINEENDKPFETVFNQLEKKVGMLSLEYDKNNKAFNLIGELDQYKVYDQLRVLVLYTICNELKNSAEALVNDYIRIFNVKVKEEQRKRLDNRILLYVTSQAQKAISSNILNLIFL